MEKNEEKTRMTWQFEGYVANITMPTGATLEMDMAPLFANAEMMNKLFLHGCKQKISDAIAGFKGSDQDKADLMQALYQQLLDGEWSTRKPAEPGLDVKALRENMIAGGFTPEQADAVLAGSKKEKKVKK